MGEGRRKIRLAAVCMAVCLMIGCMPLCDMEQPDSAAAAETEEQLREKTAQQLTEAMGKGWNLGNTMESVASWIAVYNKNATATDYEMAWGQPLTTKEMIEGVKAAGFGSVRIPVAWSNMMSDDGKYTIHADYFRRVDEIVGYVLDSGMYAIINIHWDGGWWGLLADDDEAVRAEAMNRYKTMWSQIADHYKDYSYRLIFESANEELGDFKYYDPEKDVTTYTNFSDNEKYQKVNEINQEFVNLVRGSGGKNADRFLLIAGYNTDIDKTCDDRYVMPEDTAENHLMVSVHYYTPVIYCLADKKDNSWGYAESWGTKSDKQQMRNYFSKMKKFTDAGYGVIIGEYGVAEKDGASVLKDGADVFAVSVLSLAEEYGYHAMLWDCNCWYDRNAKKLKYDNLVSVFGGADTENGGTGDLPQPTALPEESALPQDTAEPEVSPSPDAAASQEPAQSLPPAEGEPAASPDAGETKEPAETEEPLLKEGKKVHRNGLVYQVKTDKGGVQKAVCRGFWKKEKRMVKIPARISIEGRKITVKSIGKKAFCNCRKLKKVVLASRKITVAKNAFKGCKKKVKIVYKT